LPGLTAAAIQYPAADETAAVTVSNDYFSSCDIENALNCSVDVFSSQAWILASCGRTEYRNLFAFSAFCDTLSAKSVKPPDEA